ncbi:fibroblast growth factor 19 [Neosynchiropus ocellatus]
MHRLTFVVLSSCYALGFCFPLLDQDPHISNGWDQVVRHRHLYAVRAGLHLLMGRNGAIQGSADQHVLSLLEIRPVGPGCVVIRGVAAARYLCMEGDGRLYSSLLFGKDDCTFKEEILPDGYSIYTAHKHQVLLSLGNQQQRQQDPEGGHTAFARFLPRINTLGHSDTSPAPTIPHPPAQSTDQPEEHIDPMNPFGKLSQIIHSPSFHTR